MARKKRVESVPHVVMMANVTPETKAMIKSMARKLGVSQGCLCGMWMAQFDPNNEMLLEKVRHIKAKEEVLRLSATRNALIAKLHGKGVLYELTQLDSADLNVMIDKIKRRKNK